MNMKRRTLPLLALLLALLAGCGAGVSNRVTDYKVDLPAGFQEIEMEGVDVCWANAGQTSNVNLKITAKSGSTDAAFKSITAETARDTLLSAWEESYGVRPTITDRYFSKDPVCGLPAYRYSYTMELDGKAVTQILVSINADKTYAFAYTTGDEAILKEFDASAKNIQLTIE